MRAFIATYNADYARNDLDAYFRAFAPELTQWFPQGRVNLPSYRASWTKYIGAGNRIERVEVRDLQVQVGPVGGRRGGHLRPARDDPAGEGRGHRLRTTRRPTSSSSGAARWSIVHVNYRPGPGYHLSQPPQ